MSWFRRNKPPSEGSGPTGIGPGRYHSPALASLCEELDGHRLDAVLDLGASFNENLEFLSRICDHIVIRDLAGQRGGDTTAPRASTLEIDPADLVQDDDDRYDLILLWDLWHYVAPEDVPRFTAGLVRLCRPAGWVFLMASASAPIPSSPMRFRIHDEQSLDYEEPSSQRLPSPRLTTREIEKRMRGFHPERLFQLRNGLQEFLFTADTSSPNGDTDDDDDTLGRPERPPGDWY